MNKTDNYQKVINKLDEPGLDDVLQHARATVEKQGLFYSIKKLIEEVGELKKAIDKNDQREIGRVIFRIEKLLNYLYVGLGGEPKK